MGYTQLLKEGRLYLGLREGALLVEMTAGDDPGACGVASRNNSTCVTQAQFTTTSHLTPVATP